MRARRLFVTKFPFLNRWNTLAVSGWLVCFQAYHISRQGKQRQSGVSTTLGSWYAPNFLPHHTRSVLTKMHKSPSAKLHPTRRNDVLELPQAPLGVSSSCSELPEFDSPYVRHSKTFWGVYIQISIVQIRVQFSRTTILVFLAPETYLAFGFFFDDATASGQVTSIGPCTRGTREDA